MNAYYGQFGGAYVAETLVKPLGEIANAFYGAIKDPVFLAELQDLLKNFAGRPTPLTLSRNLSHTYGRKIYLKREDLLHGGAHKTNNTVGQALLAKYMGKTRLIAETGAGQHGVATAMIGALLKLPVTVYMGAVDVKRQAMNVARMKLFGAEVIAVTSGSATLKDAINEAMRDFTASADHTFYIFGTVAGPHPMPMMVRYFQQVIGMEARAEILQREGKLPDALYACVGGGSNAMGLFTAFLEDKAVKMFGAEAGGAGNRIEHAATLTQGEPGIFHGMKSYFLQDQEGNITETHSISAGLDYPGVGPEHSYLHETRRVQYEAITDQEAIQAFEVLSREEGIIPAFESSHAIALMLKQLVLFPEGSLHLVNISGRGDKDLATYMDFKERNA